MTTQVNIKNTGSNGQVIVRHCNNDDEDVLDIGTSAHVLEPGDEVSVTVWGKNSLLIEER